MMLMDAKVRCSGVSSAVEFPNIQPAAGDERHMTLTLLRTSGVSATEDVNLKWVPAQHFSPTTYSQSA